jgi:hypothetical protein
VSTKPGAAQHQCSRVSQAREPFAMFDQLMQSAQSIGLMREISVRHEFAMRVRRVLRAVDGL